MAHLSASTHPHTSLERILTWRMNGGKSFLHSFRRVKSTDKRQDEKSLLIDRS